MTIAIIIGILALAWLAALVPVWCLCVAAARGDEIYAAARRDGDASAGPVDGAGPGPAHPHRENAEADR